jgi:lipoprotein NlpD
MLNSPLKRPVHALNAAVIACVLLSACSNGLHRAPVEDRPSGTRSGSSNTAATTNTADSTPAQAPPGIENLGKPGYYEVKTGDTLIHVALENGQNWRDLVKWNNLDNPNTIEMGQVLRVLPPGIDASVATTKPITTAKIETKPLDGAPAAPVALVAPAGVTPKPPAAPASGAVATPANTAVKEDGDDAAPPANVTWAWPATGAVVTPFSEGKVKGVSINGKAGDPVLAAADGKVVYAGSGLRGYGNLIILKHNSIYLTAYAHNQALLVKEDQSVRRGQKIAEMGSSDSESVRLHFEVRKQGKPVDPTRLLPQR